MKILKCVAGVFLGLIVILALSVIVIEELDKRRTSFLDLADNKALKINSFLLKNVNIVPMNADTVF